MNLEIGTEVAQFLFGEYIITINVPVVFTTTGTLVVLCTQVLLCTVVVCCCVFLCVRGVGRSPCGCCVSRYSGGGGGLAGLPLPLPL